MIDFNFLSPLITCIIECISFMAESGDFLDCMSTAIDSTVDTNILGVDHNTGEIIYDTSDPLPDHDLLFENLDVSINDDHLTCGI